MAGDDIYIEYYFVLTGLHFAHYIVGMGMLRRASVIGAIKLNEHIVDLSWLLIYPVVYLQVAQ